MLAAYVAVTVVAAVAYAVAAVLNFTHNKSVAETAETRLPEFVGIFRGAAERMRW
jgi:hypothetical protein